MPAPTLPIQPKYVCRVPVILAHAACAFVVTARTLAAIALCGLGTWAFAASTITADRLTIGSDLTYPPYAFFDAGKPAGFDADRGGPVR